MSIILTIITINRNNADGLKKTLLSVSSQTSREFEHIIIDGASADESKTVIQEYASLYGDNVKWVSEPDDGIYNAMNKGIRMASGEFLQFLNSGDRLVSAETTAQMLKALQKAGYPTILYGNMLKDSAEGVSRDEGFAGETISFSSFYKGTLNHSPTYIKRTLFDKYGLYDETLKIVSDWKWFLQAIVLGEEKPVYTKIDVTLFDMTGISETNMSLRMSERELVLNDLIPQSILLDYKNNFFHQQQIKRLLRHPWAYKIVWFIERCLFKLEKWHNKKSNRVK